MQVGLVTDARYRQHLTGAGHPESPGRLNAVDRGIAAAVPDERLVRIDAREALPEELELCHTADYVGLVAEECADGFPCLSTGDTRIGPASFDIACLGVGGVLAAVDAVMEGRVSRAFCAPRPPGHHASQARGMGFCVFNNIAVGARYAQARYGIERIAILDWDVHHGNGTQDIFYEDGTVFTFSTHQWPCYPGTGRASEAGAGAGKGTVLNHPVAMGSGRRDVIEQGFRSRLLPAMRAFRPELILVSAGFDSRAGDPLGGLQLTDEDFVELTQLAMALADASAAGRLVSVLEGGYALGGLASATGAHVAALAGVAPARKAGQGY